MTPRILLLPLLLVLAACGDKNAEEAQTPQGETTVLTDDIPKAFTPLRPAIVDVGDGTWICTPAGAGQVSRCAMRGTQPPAAPDTATNRAATIIEQARANTPTN